MTDENKMWGIRGVSEDIKSAALREAKKSGINVGEWLEIAIREKIKNDRNQSKSLTVKQASNPVNIADASQVVQMLKDLKDIGADAPESLKKQALSLVRKAMIDVKQGKRAVEQNKEKSQQD